MLDDLVESSESLADDHTHVDVLEVQHSDGHVGAEDQHEQDQVPVRRLTKLKMMLNVRNIRTWRRLQT